MLLVQLSEYELSPIIQSIRYPVLSVICKACINFPNARILPVLNLYSLRVY